MILNERFPEKICDRLEILRKLVTQLGQTFQLDGRMLVARPARVSSQGVVEVPGESFLLL